MAKRKVTLTKIRIQKFETNIEQEKNDPDEMADQAWLQFNKVDPDVETEYITKVSKIDQTQL